MVERTALGILMESSKPDDIPSSAQWLAGQGAGSWYNIESTSTTNQYKINRYSKEGEFEFEALFSNNRDTDFCIDCPYVFTYLSHYKVCHIIQHGKTFKFLNIENE